jgi:hypothetical protein
MAAQHALALQIDKSNRLPSRLVCTVCGWQGKIKIPIDQSFMPNSKKFQAAKREYDAHVKAASYDS